MAKRSRLIIDCNQVARSTKDDRLICSVQMGLLEWDARQIGLFSHRLQKQGKDAPAADIEKALQSKKPLPASVMFVLLDNIHEIPENWKGLDVCFWGTKRMRYGNLPFVYKLLWQPDCGWHFSSTIITHNMSRREVAAILLP